MSFQYSRSYIGLVKAVIVDLAGTTVDFGSRAPAGAFVEVFRKNGIDITVAQARGPMGMEKKDHIRALSQLPDVVDKWQKAHGAPCADADIDRMYAEFIPLQLDCLPKFGDLIPGTLEFIEDMREMGVKIGATTGYNREMMELVLKGAKKQGFVPDAAVCAGDVAAGRPAPWMIYRCMEQLGAYPPESVVVIGDTIPDIEAGLNARVWSVGVAATGNMVGLSEQELEALDEAVIENMLDKATEKMFKAGAHYVGDGIDDCDMIIEEICDRLAEGEKP